LAAGLQVNANTFDRPDFRHDFGGHKGERVMKPFAASVMTISLLAALGSCSKGSSSNIDLRGRLMNLPEDYLLVLCETGESLWVDVYTLQPWWPEMTSAVDAGGGLAPPLYVEMKAKVGSNGPYGHGVRMNRAIVEIDEIRAITATIPPDCQQ
jgi:hypothetical protein